MTCKDCIHYEACCNWTEEEHGAMEVTTAEEGCNYFKDKSKFIELPCKVGDTVYVIPSKVNYALNKLNGHSENNRVYEQTVDEVRIYRNGDYLLITCGGLHSVHKQFFKIDWFLTREEAEKALKER